MGNPTQNRYQIHDLLKNRWSPRAFAARAVEADKILCLFEAARWSPSGGNLQPWAFIVTSPADPEPYQKIIEVLRGRNPDWAKNAPVLVLTAARTDREGSRPNPTAMYDLGQAVAHLTVQAGAMGLSVRQMGGFDKEKARALFVLPEGYDPITVLAIGYQGSPEVLPEDLRLRELEARTRKPLAEFVFDGRWNEPLGEDAEAAEVAEVAKSVL